MHAALFPTALALVRVHYRDCRTLVPWSFREKTDFSVFEDRGVMLVPDCSHSCALRFRSCSLSRLPHPRAMELLLEYGFLCIVDCVSCHLHDTVYALLASLLAFAFDAT